MRVAFDQPLWLLGLLAVPVVILLGRRGIARVRPRQQRTAAWLRAAAVALLVLALAGPRWSAAGRDVDVAFLLDASDSVSAGRSAGLDWIEQALAGKGEADRAGLALFGNDARLEYTLRQDPPREPVATVIDGSASDLSRALRLSQGVLGSERRRRAVLLTDGRETSGNAVRAAEELAAAGIQVDVVSIGTGQSADVLVDEVISPSRVREGEVFDVIGVLRNTGDRAVDVVVVVTADGAEVHRETVTAEPGRTRVVVPQTATEGGTVRYEVRLSSGASTLPANDVARAAVQVQGPPKVLIYEGEAGLGDDLSRAFEASAIANDRIAASTQAFPSLDRLLDYESVVLVDVPVSSLDDTGVQALDAYVRDAGRGLLAIGGPNSYGMGGYDGTPLEDLLPVFARVKDPKRRPSVAEALVVDVSGSMAACHCRPDGFAGGPGGSNEGGINKTDITREAVARAVRALQAQDTVGVLAFNANSEWVIPLQSLPSDAVVDDALARLHPDGETSVPQAVREAIAGLKDTNARLRHIVLFTDGFSDDPDMVEAAREAAEAGITLSVVATGEGTGEVLRRMAEAGNGRYYPGRDLFSIPDIIVSEVQFAARPIINEGAFLPIVSGLAAPTEDLTQSPPLYGYLATTAKPTARQLLQIGEERDPLLATWQAGLGTAVAWTSDASPRWSRDWVTWESYAGFWSDVIKTTFPSAANTDFGLSASATSEGIRITLEGASAVPSDATASATVVFPDGSRREVELLRTSLTTYEAIIPGGDEGVYAVSGRLQRGDTDLFRDAVTAIRAYSPEYAATQADPELLARIAAAGGGRLDPDVATIFDPEGLVPGSSSRPIWPWLAAIALVLLVADVGMRRLRLEREDAGRAVVWLRARLSRSGRTVVAERSEQAEGLLAAKRRAGGTTTALLDRPDTDADADADADAGPDADADADVRPEVPPREAPATPRAPAPPAAEPPTAAPPPTAPGTSGLLEARRRAREQRGE